MRVDLKKHLLVGRFIGFVMTVVTTFALLNFSTVQETSCVALGVLVGIAVTYVIGWVKEYVYDKSGKGTVGRDDLRYTVRGGIQGSGLAAAGLFIVFFATRS